MQCLTDNVLRFLILSATCLAAKLAVYPAVATNFEALHLWLDLESGGSIWSYERHGHIGHWFLDGTIFEGCSSSSSFHDQYGHQDHFICLGWSSTPNIINISVSGEVRPSSRNSPYAWRVSTSWLIFHHYSQIWNAKRLTKPSYSNRSATELQKSQILEPWLDMKSYIFFLKTVAIDWAPFGKLKYQMENPNQNIWIPVFHLDSFGIVLFSPKNFWAVPIPVSQGRHHFLSSRGQKTVPRTYKNCGHHVFYWDVLEKYWDIFGYGGFRN